VHDHFGVRPALEAVAAPLELGAQLVEIVDLAVEDHRHRPVFIEHGLVAGGEVDDGQPAVTQPDPAPEMHAVGVGASMRHHGGHAPDQLRIYWIPRIDVGDSRDAAHGQAAFCATSVRYSSR
jgi:hypothetical protein